MAILISYPHMVTRMERWKFNSTMPLVKVELLVQLKDLSFISTVWCSLDFTLGTNCLGG